MAGRNRIRTRLPQVETLVRMVVKGQAEMVELVLTGFAAMDY
jgi:hypothetical protein